MDRQVIPEAAVEAAWHGTLGGYTNHKCRCDKCREANRIYNTGAKARRYASLKDPLDARHGSTNFYGNYGCRCDRCTAAWAVDIVEDARNRRAAA